MVDLQNTLILLPPSSSLSAQTGLWFSAIYFRITEECVPRVSFWTHLYLHHVVVMKVLWARTIQSNLLLKCQAHIQDAIYWLIIKACTAQIKVSAWVSNNQRTYMACHREYSFLAVLDMFSNPLFRFLMQWAWFYSFSMPLYLLCVCLCNAVIVRVNLIIFLINRLSVS